MKKYLVLFLIYLVLFLILILAGCSQRYPNSPYEDENGNNIPQKGKISYFPDNIGSYWIYEKYELDTLNNRIKNSLSFDSVIVAGELLKSGKLASYFVTYNKQFGIYSLDNEKYYHIENSKLFSLQSYLEVFMQGFPFDLSFFNDTAWVKIVDPEDDLWRLYRQKFDNQNVGLPLTTLSGKMEILASLEGTKTFKIDGTNILTKEYLISFDFNGQLNTFLGSLNIIIQRELYQYYADGIG